VEQPLGRREILQPVLAERLGGHRVPYCVAHRRSHHDLPAVRGGLDARRQVDIEPRITVVAVLDNAPVQPHPDPQLAHGRRPRMPRERPLRRHRRPDREH
jgi:hypothetical protein